MVAATYASSIFYGSLLCVLWAAWVICFAVEGRHGQLSVTTMGFADVVGQKRRVSTLSTSYRMRTGASVPQPVAVVFVVFVRSRTSGALGRQSGRTWPTKTRRSGTQRGHKRRSKFHHTITVVIIYSSSRPNCRRVKLFSHEGDRSAIALHCIAFVSSVEG